MIDGALRTMIDEVLPRLRKLFGTAVAAGRFRRHLSVIPGRRAAPDPESRCEHGICFWIPGSLAEFIIGPRFARTRWLAPRNDE
jgi:hypothetical protein